MPLSREHHRALLFAQGLRRDGPPTLRALVPEEAEARRAHVRDAWRREIAPHFALEEEALLPALEGHAPELDAEVARVRADHRRLEGLAERAARGGEEAAHALGVALVAHIRSEERGLFTMAQERLGEARLTELLGERLGPA